MKNGGIFVSPGLGNVDRHGGSCGHEAGDHAAHKVAENVVAEIAYNQIS